MRGKLAIRYLVGDSNTTKMFFCFPLHVFFVRDNDGREPRPEGLNLDDDVSLKPPKLPNFGKLPKPLSTENQMIKKRKHFGLYSIIFTMANTASHLQSTLSKSDNCDECHYYCSKYESV